MLVLSRKAQECVVIGGTDGLERTIRVTVLGICGGRVRLGFEADADIPVHRAEARERHRTDGQAPPQPTAAPVPAS